MNSSDKQQYFSDIYGYPCPSRLGASQFSIFFSVLEIYMYILTL